MKDFILAIIAGVITDIFNNYFKSFQTNSTSAVIKSQLKLNLDLKFIKVEYTRKSIKNSGRVS